MEDVFVHRTALVESAAIGKGTRIWAFVHVLPGATIGANCNIGDHSFVESGARIGDDVTVKNGNAIWEGLTLEDGVFVGPGVVFTNDLRPRSPRLAEAADRYADTGWLTPTTVCRGATLGAGPSRITNQMRKATPTTTAVVAKIRTSMPSRCS